MTASIGRAGAGSPAPAPALIAHRTTATDASRKSLIQSISAWAIIGGPSRAAGPGGRDARHSHDNLSQMQLLFPSPEGFRRQLFRFVSSIRFISFHLVSSRFISF